MTKTKIVFTIPGDDAPVKVHSLTLDAINQGFTTADLISKVVPQNAINLREIYDTDEPEDEIFRAAWDDSNQESFIGLNIPKAKLIAHDLRRIEREKKLAPLDKEEIFVTTATTRKAEIATEKTAILDANALVQTDIDAAANETELRAVLTGAGII